MFVVSGVRCHCGMLITVTSFEAKRSADRADKPDCFQLQHARRNEGDADGGASPDDAYPPVGWVKLHKRCNGFSAASSVMIKDDDVCAASEI